MHCEGNSGFDRQRAYPLPRLVMVIVGNTNCMLSRFTLQELIRTRIFLPLNKIPTSLHRIA